MRAACWYRNFTYLTFASLKKYLKYTVKGLSILLGILVLLYLVVYIYVVANKKEIIERVRHEISEELTGDVKIGNVDISYFRTFPRVSVLLENVSITDTMFARHNHPFFKAEKLFAQINVIRLIQKKDPLSGIRVDNGQLYVYTDTSGYTNSYLLTGKKKIADPAIPKKDKNIITDITLRNVRLIMDNKQKAKLYDFDVNRLDCDIKSTDSTVYIKTKNNVLIHNLAFNLNKGSFGKETLVEGNIDLQYSKSREQLSFKNLKIDLKGHPFVFTGIFNLGVVKDFSIKISTEEVGYDFARSLLTEKIAHNLAKFKATEPVDAVAEISGPLTGGEPLVKVQWTVKRNNVQTPYVDFTNASFTGSYTNELVPGLPRNDVNSRVQFHKVKADWQGLTIHLDNVYIDNLIEPMVNCDVKTDFTLPALNNLLNSSSLKLNEGKGALDITYSGPLQENTNKNTLINGKFTLQNARVLYQPRGLELKDCNGVINFKNSDVAVGFNGNVGGNKIDMNGGAKNLLSLIKTNPGKISLDWNVHSPSLNLETFTALLKKRNKVAVVVSNAQKGKLTKLASRIDNMLNQANVRLNVKADKLEYKKFNASNVVASITLLEDSYNLNRVSLQHGNGSMLITGYLRGANEYYQEAKVKVNMDNVDINKVLYAFNNFGQDAIKSDNIEGKLTSSIDVRMDIDRQLKKTPTNIQGFLDFSLKNGALINFEPIQKLQNFLFKNRDFKDIRFAELKDRLDVKDGDIKINRMEIQSTALSMYVEGVYSLKGNTDISIQVPLSNLKKRGEDYKPENIGADAKGGTSVFVRGQPGPDGNIKFKYDMFKKFRSSDKKGER